MLLEPIMRLEVVTPEDYLGGITADLSSRRALIDRTSTRGRLMVIDARAPLEKMFGYSTAVRSLSQGRAGYTMEPLEYAAGTREPAGGHCRDVSDSPDKFSLDCVDALHEPLLHFYFPT